jgi:EAL domain-containing protein (putative c-di-GMP-specific phosphodiesterase class I)
LLLALWAQPIVRLGDPFHLPVAHELLLRARTPAGRLLSPSRLVADMERRGTVDELDAWVVAEACGLLSVTQTLLRAQINVSGRTVDEHGNRYVDALADRLGRWGVEPSRVTVEITEGWPVSSPTVVRRFARALVELGCRVALDDFGAAGQSLRLLAAVDHIHQVKIDGALITACSTNVRARTIVPAAVRMAAAVGAETVAEAVPDSRTAEWLEAHGATMAQAFIYGRPAPIGRGDLDATLGASAVGA